MFLQDFFELKRMLFRVYLVFLYNTYIIVLLKVSSEIFKIIFDFYAKSCCKIIVIKKNIN